MTVHTLPQLSHVAQVAQYTYYITTNIQYFFSNFNFAIGYPDVYSSISPILLLRLGANTHLATELLLLQSNTMLQQSFLWALSLGIKASPTGEIVPVYCM